MVYVTNRQNVHMMEASSTSKSMALNGGGRLVRHSYSKLAVVNTFSFYVL